MFICYTHHMKRFLKLLIQILMGVASLVILLPVLPFLNAINPMQQAFINDFHITNNTDKDIFITPMGTYNGGDYKIIMRQFTSKSPAFPVEQDRDLLVKTKETRRVFFEDDNYHLSQIVIKDDQGKYKQINVACEVTACDKVRPKAARFEINNSSILADIDENTVYLLKCKSYRFWFYWFSSVILLVSLWLWHRRF